MPPIFFSPLLFKKTRIQLHSLKTTTLTLNLSLFNTISVHFHHFGSPFHKDSLRAVSQWFDTHTHTHTHTEREREREREKENICLTLLHFKSVKQKWYCIFARLMNIIYITVNIMVGEPWIHNGILNIWCNFSAC